MKVKLTLMAVLAATAVMMAPSPASAVCNQTSASQADKDLYNVHGCWADYFNWAYQAYDMRYSDWSNRGWSDACNINKEFAKHWNASYLVTYRLPGSSYQWHHSSDYRALAERYSSNYHGAIYHTCKDDSCCFGSYSPSSGNVATHCPVYDAAATNGNPASRAGDFMHEGWHAWLKKYNFDNGSCGGHRCGPTGNCSSGGCDYFYWHPRSRFPAGTLWQNDGTANKFHSPNQIQVEFLCDIADAGDSATPASVRQSAKADADWRAVSRFINGPGYKCGGYRPW